MIGDTSEEMMALYYGLGIGFLAGLQVMFMFLIWWFKKRGYFLRGTKPNNNAGIDTAKASIMNIPTAKASPDIASSLNCKNKTYITKKSIKYQKAKTEN